MFKTPGAVGLQSVRKVLFNFNCLRFNHKWIEPQGHDTGIKVYSRLNKEKVPLKLLNKNLVKWYICGPTVYDVSHIGHASCYIRFDLINRILKEFFGIHPVIALGITDVDDKIIKRALRKKVDFRAIAKEYELEFFHHLHELNILPPSFVLRVTEHIPEIIEFISKIIDKGKAYPTEDGSVYFEQTFFNEEGEEVLEEQLGSQSPIRTGQKRRSHFALWKGAKPNEPYWEAPWGKGRPGWHIECSAMASKIFGSKLDLHGGGIDLVFPHHVCEEAQSCCYHDQEQWVDYWLHTGELQLMEVKMSKSLNNFISISDFLKKNTADHLRMFCFISKYRKGLHYGSDALILPVASCELITKFLGEAKSYVKGDWVRGNVSESELLQDLKETEEKVRKHLMNDFDTAQCHIVLMDLIRKTVRMLNEEADVSVSRSPAAVAAVSQYVQRVFRSFGFQLGSSEAVLSKDDQRLQFVIEKTVNFRDYVRTEALQLEEKSRKGNLLRACDSLRNEFGTVGIVIKDMGSKGSSWSMAEGKVGEESRGVS